MKTKSRRKMMASDTPETPAGAGVCENCGAKLHGRYCSECGQDAVEAVVPLRVLAARGLAEVFSVDLRYPRTLKALALPGRLTSLYLSGHRVPYVPPLRLALSASVVLFVAIALRMPGGKAITANSGLFEDLGLLAREHAMAFTVAQLLVLPVFASLLKVGFGRIRPLYLSHLTFALHYHAAVTITAFAALLVSFVAPFELAAWLAFVLFLWMIGPYLVLALRRTYGAPWLKILLLWPVLAFGYVGMNLMVFGLIAGLAAFLRSLSG
ncbi:MAG: DUF3667 domain-containing protein [Calditrichaeota bacterium]|nr:MAG: DUF3667 domain-containing protein [Calditrichota bacterium]